MCAPSDDDYVTWTLADPHTFAENIIQALGSGALWCKYIIAQLMVEYDSIKMTDQDHSSLDLAVSKVMC